MVVQVNNARRDLDGKDYEGEGSEAGVLAKDDSIDVATLAGRGFRSSITSQVSNVTGSRMPRNCAGSGVPGPIRPLIGTTGARGFVEAAAPLYNGALTRMKRAGRGVGRE